MISRIKRWLSRAATKVDRYNLPAATVYTDTAQTFTTKQTFNAVLGLGTATPSINGEIGYDGTNVLFRESGVNKTLTGLSGLTAPQIIIAASSSTLTCDPNFTFDPTTDILTLGASSKTRVSHTAGTLATGEYAQYVTAKLATSTAAETAVYYNLSGGGSGTTAKVGCVFALGNSDMTATGSDVAAVAYCLTASTGSNLNCTTVTTYPTGNTGLYASSGGTTVGMNVGLAGDVKNAAINIGVFGKSVSAKTTNIGVLGVAGASTNNVGGFFALGATNPTIAVTAALVADNQAIDSPIALFRHNGTNVFSIGKTGLITHAVGTMATSEVAQAITATFVTGDTTETGETHVYDGGGANAGAVAKKGAYFSIQNSNFTANGFAIGLQAVSFGFGTTGGYRAESTADPARGAVGIFGDVRGGNTPSYEGGMGTGAAGVASGHTNNTGVYGKATDAYAAGAGVGWNVTNIGVLGIAGAATNNVAVFASLGTTSPTTTTTAALVADNNAVDSYIARFRHNTTDVVTIDNNGLLTVSQGLQMASFTPTVNGQIGWDGTNLLFRESGTNKTIPAASTFSGNINDTTNGYLNNSASDTAVPVKDIDGFSVQNGDGTESIRFFSLQREVTNSMSSFEMHRDNAGSVFLPSLANGEAWGFFGIVTGYGTAGTVDNKGAAWTISGLIKNIGGTTTLVQSQATSICSTDAVAWGVTMSADDTNDRLQLNVAIYDTGSTVKFIATLQVTKVLS